jgi:hypothetical protein
LDPFIEHVNMKYPNTPGRRGRKKQRSLSPARNARTFARDYLLEGLEPRVLLALIPDTLTVGSPLQSTEYNNGPINVTVGQAVQFDARITYPAGGPAPQGEVILAPDQEPSPYSTENAVEVTNYSFPSPGVAIATATLELNQYINSSAYDFVYAYFRNDGNYVETTSVTANSDGAAQEDGSYVPFNFTSSPTSDRLAFRQNPRNSAAGDTFAPPVTVEVQNASTGAVDANSNDAITLSIAGGDGTLKGTTTVNAVDGLATFSNLSIDQSGTFTLKASDSTNSATTAVTSTTFKVTAGKLVFTKPPAAGSAGATLGPIIVTLEDSKNKVITTADGTAVTLDIVGLLDANPITGNTASLVNGVATFDDLTLAKPGFYQLQASDGGDAEVTSNKFKVAGDKLIFIAQPKTGTVNTPLTMEVEALTAKGNRDTELDDAVQLGLNVIAEKTSATLGGTTAVALVGGVASFTAANDVAIDLPGTYTLTAAAANADGTDYTVASATSAKFKTNAVTLKQISGTVAGSSKKISTDDGLTISGSNAVAVLQSDAAMSLVATGLSPATPAVLGKIGWVIERNQTDIASGATPALTVSAADPLEASVSLSGIGSFNLICYYDANSNGAYDAGEELKVFHLAEVSVMINAGAGSVTTNSSQFASRPYGSGQSTILQDGTFAGPYAIQMSEPVQLIGGGADGMIGLSKIHMGFVQDGLSDSFAVKYQNGNIAMTRLTDGSYPIMDASYPPNPSAPSAIFTLPIGQLYPRPKDPGPARDLPGAADPAGGQDRTVTTADSPSEQLQNTSRGASASSTSGGSSFITYLSAYSDDFNRNYEGYLTVNWSEIYQFSNVLGHWVNTGSSVSDTVNVLPAPTTLEALGAKTTGPLFADSTITI